MRKIEFICSLSNGNNLGGETLKNEILYKYFRRKAVNFNLLDFEKYKNNKIIILIKCIISIINPFTDKILLSKASLSSYYFLKLFYYLNFFNKKIYYMVIGGTFPKFLENKTFNIKYYKNIEKIYIESLKMKEKMINMGLEQTEYLPNFKDFKMKDRSEKKISLPLKAVFFSRVTKEKGTEMIFKMLREINQNGIKVEVDFYGPIEEGYREEFKNKVSLISSANYKGILKQGEETYDILSKYDFMLFPTLYYNEGIPGSIIDAFISALPIISAKWENYNQILNSNISYEFEIANQKQFEKIIFDLINNPKQLLEKRKKCFEESKKYHIDNVLKKILEEIN